MADYDLAIIGGGLNGASVARDAAGRGLRVILLEQNDIGAGASSAALSLVHGDLLAVERGRLWELRRSIAERDQWLKIAPHLMRPAHFVVPMHSQGRLPWLWRLGLAAHNRFARRGPLPAGETIDLTHHLLGDPLKRPFGLAFGYWGGIIDSARLTVLTAVDAAERGAVILTGAKCVRADRSDIWRLIVTNRGQREIVTARTLVNAAGGWITSVAETVLRVLPPRVRLVQSSQIVVRRLAAHDSSYILQNADRRLVYVVPLAHDATLIGTAERDFSGDPAMAVVSSHDTTYLQAAVNRYFREQLEPSDMIHSLAGVDVVPSSAPSEMVESPAHEGFVGLQRKFREAPLLTIFGGSTMNARRLAESAIAALAPFFAAPGPWTAHASLPGGNIAFGAAEGFVAQMQERWPFLASHALERMVQAYGTRVERVLEGVSSAADLGPDFGEGLSGREVGYLMKSEYARFADDVLWRRSRLGLTASAENKAALAQFMKSHAPAF